MDVHGDQTVAQVRARLEADLGVSYPKHPVALAMDHGALVMDGEVESVAAKKRALEIAAATPGVSGIVDRLHVTPAQRLGDGEIRDHVVRALSEESALLECALTMRRGEHIQAIRVPAPKPRGQIEVRVEDGIVTLDGELPSLTHKRLAEALVWWVPGVRDVVNGLGVSPPEEDSDDEITEALEIVLQKDPLLKGTKIGVFSDARVVTLYGTVRSDEQRKAAEEDAWCLFGVDRVKNALRVG